VGHAEILDIPYQEFVPQAFEIREVGMQIIEFLIRGMMDAALYWAIPTTLFVYGCAIIGDRVNKRVGLRVAGSVATFLAASPFILIVCMFYADFVKGGIEYPQYGDQFLGFYLLGGSALCALVAVGTFMNADRFQNLLAQRRGLSRRK
jgi:hypothetical protein